VYSSKREQLEEKTNETRMTSPSYRIMPKNIVGVKPFDMRHGLSTT